MGMFRSRFLTFVVFVSMVMALVPLAQPAAALSTTVVISQLYGGGGNTGATFRNDFIELFNRGGAAVSVTGWSVQYASSAGTSWAATSLSGTIQPGQYYLVQEAQGAGGTTNLPTPDATGTIAMSATGAKVALVNSTTALTGSGCPFSGTVVDFVGYDGANCAETTATPALTNTTAAIRKNAGCTETDSNVADFDTGAPAPRNTSSPLHFCTGDNAPAVTATSPLAGATGVAFNTDISITFSEPVNVSSAWYTIVCATSGSHLAAQSGGPTTFTLDLSIDFAFSESCTVTVLASEVTDQDTVDPPNNMSANYVFSFTSEAPPPPPTFIHDIQGAAHISPLNGQTFGNVPGIVTARRTNGFNLQDPNPDSDPATSEGIFVFTSSAPTSVTVGDAVRVKATVSEFRPGGATTANLTTTELASPTITVLSHGNALPAATVIGLGGRMPPTSVIEDDASSGNVETSGVFDPASDGLDFYESLEGMRVQINDPVIVGPTNSFNEIPVLPDNGSWAGPRTARGGILYSYADGNPERIVVDDAIVSIPGGLNVGDHFAGFVTGVMDYNFGLFMVELTQTPVRVPGLLAKETTADPTVNELTVATFNVQNLDPGDGTAKFNTLAGLIVNNMKSPDLIAVEEVQDNNGATDNGVVDPSVTIGNLITAISTAGGPTYGYRQINPVNDQDGGEPGGNIRQIFLFRTDRGLSFVDRLGGDSTTATTVTSVGGTAQLSFSPGRIDPTNAAWNSSRKPLAAEFLFNGQRLYVVANHFNSKGGDQPLTGRFQPPVRSSEVQRHQQATIEADFVQQIRAIDPNANVVVLGDLNDFEFSDTIHILEAAGLTDLYDTVPLAERYSYVFEGNSQTLDHILVSGSLLNRSTLDVVHVNAEFADQASDHDPSVARILMNDESILCALAQRVVAKSGIANSLCAKLDNAAAARNRGDLKAAQNMLKAFANEVNAQRGKAITTEDADLLILLASRL
ncbi:MAG TPA: lamin tail domain-containing protein [Candidatus Limnocylindria bacterium]